MIRRLPLSVALAALVGFAAPTLAAEHAAKHDPQVATSAAKAGTHHEKKAAPAKETKGTQVKGRKAAKAKKAKESSKATAAQPAPQTQAPAPAPAPAK